MKQTINDLSEFLTDNDIFYIHTEPEIVDFTKTFTGQVFISGKQTYNFQLEDKNFDRFIAFLSITLFKENKIVYSWDIKRFFSYVYFRLPRHYKIDILCKLVDIKYVESFLGKNEEKPKFLKEAHQRAKQSLSCWKIHNNIHLPLATRILPKMETAGIADLTINNRRFSFYQIEGQKNGRLSASAPKSNFFTPHSMGEKQKFNLRPAGKFLCLDYKAMEVCVLQTLSDDKKLKAIVESGRDIYETIFWLFFNKKTKDESDRNLIKDSFLPIVYGIQQTALSEKLGIGPSQSLFLIENVKKHFSQAMDWVETFQKKGESEDYFGRKRSHEKPWAARNAVVQGPAAIVCQEKLIDLYDRLPYVVMNIHDGYVLDVLQDFHGVAVEACVILEEESKLCPGLKVRVDVKTGDNLFDLKNYEI